ncbi:hypothetical protein D9M69_529990 [compost metagenome]
MVNVVRPQSVPAASAMASPSHWPATGEPCMKPSPNATATAANAIVKPIHWMRRSFSPGTTRGSSSATTNGLV